MLLHCVFVSVSWKGKLYESFQLEKVLDQEPVDRRGQQRMSCSSHLTGLGFLRFCQEATHLKTTLLVNVR